MELGFLEHSPWFRSPIPVYRAWCQFLWLLRLWLQQREFTETPTPTLVTCPGTDPSIDFVAANDVYLPSSPEISLKKVMALKFDRIFEIKPCFRGDLSSPHHLQEFTMLEWYEANTSFENLLDRSEELVLELCRELNLPPPTVTRWRVSELFEKHLQVQLPVQAERRFFADLCTKLEVFHRDDETVDDLFHRLWMEKIEPHFVHEELTFVTHYPAFQAAYAQIDPQGWAERVELFWKGLELGNGYNEVIDAEEQETRMRRDNDQRRRAGRPQVPVDENFLQALRSGLPPTTGIAIGLERLFMALMNVKDISQIHQFR